MNKFYDESMGNLASKPSLVIDTLTELLGMQGSKLKPYYWIGNDAHTLWRAFHSLLTTVADSIKRLIQVHPIQPDIPPVNVISHITITVMNIDKSVPFYQAFGLEVVGEKKNGYQFLRSRPSKWGWPTHVLLKEGKNMLSRGKSTGGVGMTRLCMYASNVKAEADRLEKSMGLKPMAPQAHSKSGATIVAFQDPDGFVVYIIRMPVVVDAVLRFTKCWWKKASTPSMFHWTVNVSDIKTSLSIFEKLGFVKMFDGSGDQILYDLVPAFGMKEEGCFIEAYRLCKLPNDAFMTTIMGWVTPKSEVKADALLIH